MNNPGRRFTIAILAATLLALGVACAGGGPPPPRKGAGLAEQYWREGGKLAARGNLDGAIGRYEQALEVQPDFLACLNDLGLVYIMKGWHDRALGVFRRALEYDDDYVEVRAGICEAYWNLGNFARCVAEADTAIEHASRLPRPYFWRGMANRRLGRNEAAERDLLAAIDRNSRYDVAHLALGEMFFQNGLHAKADRRFKAAIDSNPRLIPAYLVWAQMKMKQGDLDAAEQLLKRASSRARNNPAPHTMMGYVNLARSNRARGAGDEAAYRAHAESAMTQFKTALRFDRTAQDAKDGLEETRRRLRGSD